MLLNIPKISTCSRFPLEQIFLELFIYTWGSFLGYPVYVQRKRGCAVQACSRVQARHAISVNKDVQNEQGTSASSGKERHFSKILLIESIFFLMCQLKTD